MQLNILEFFMLATQLTSLRNESKCWFLGVYTVWAKSAVTSKCTGYVSAWRYSPALILPKSSKAGWKVSECRSTTPYWTKRFTSRWTLWLYGISASGRSICRSCSFSGDSSRFCSSRSVAWSNNASLKSRHLARMASTCVWRFESDPSSMLFNKTCSSDRHPLNPYRSWRVWASALSNDSALFIVGASPPSFEDSDHAIWRRWCRIPCVAHNGMHFFVLMQVSEMLHCNISATLIVSHRVLLVQ